MGLGIHDDVSIFLIDMSITLWRHFRAELTGTVNYRPGSTVFMAAVSITH